MARPRVTPGQPGSSSSTPSALRSPGHPVADFFSLTMDQVFELSFHNPDPYRIDPSTLPPAAQAIAAGNRAALAVYAGTSMSDPTLSERLSTLDLPVLVLWGDSDQIVDPDYGRAYAAAIPMARFQLLTDTGHMPQIETPDQLLEAILDGARAQCSAAGADFGSSQTRPRSARAIAATTTTLTVMACAAPCWACWLK